MSTLMSKDLNIERSSTRRHAPPGGQSSFSLSHEDNDEKPVRQQKAKSPAKPAEKETVPPPPVTKNTSNKSPRGSTRNFLSHDYVEEEDEDLTNAQKLKKRRAMAANAEKPAEKAVEKEVEKPSTAEAVTGTRSSTRVRQAPGGNSSFVLG